MACLYYYAHPPKINEEFVLCEVHNFPENKPFEQRLQHWKENFEFKSGQIYTSQEIKEKFSK